MSSKIADSKSNIGNTVETIDKMDILKHIHTVQRDEVKFRRDREYQVFAWTNSIFVALIGVLLLSQPSQGVIWGSYGINGKIIASIAVLVLVVYSSNWQYRNLRIQDKSAKIIVKINRLFHLFEKGFFDSTSNDALYPDEWVDWGTPSKKITKKLSRLLFSANYISTTMLLGILAIVMIWVA